MEEIYAVFNAILQPYIGETLILGKKYRSPLRGRRDSSPSFQVNKRGKYIRWIDYGDRKEWQDEYALVMGIHGISFLEAKAMIEAMDFPTNVKIKQRKVPIFRPKWGTLNYSEYLVWDEINVRPSTLNKYKVKGARLLVCDDRVIYDYEKDPPAFFYLGETLEDWQYYNPSRKRQKKSLAFVRNGHILLGWEQLPLAGERLLIASGMKDGLCLYECGVPFLAGSGEGDLINFRRVMPELKLRFKDIRSIYDPDLAGRKATDDFYKEFGVPPADFIYPNNKDDIAKLSAKRGIKFLRDSLRIN